jgi:hypothetical protein
MSMPVGTWTISLLGPTAVQHGTLTLSASAGSLTIGGATNDLSVLWDDAAQQITFTTAAVPVTAPFAVYRGWAFQPHTATVPPIMLAGTFWLYTPGGPAAPVSKFDWYATGAPKVKEKEKEKEKEHKDKEKDKEHKDKEADKHPPDKLPEFQFGPGGSNPTNLQMLEQRVAQLEQKLASGQSFIKPEERPQVGEAAFKSQTKGKGDA